MIINHKSASGFDDIHRQHLPLIRIHFIFVLKINYISFGLRMRGRTITPYFPFRFVIMWAMQWPDYHKNSLTDRKQVNGERMVMKTSANLTISRIDITPTRWQVKKANFTQFEIDELHMAHSDQIHSVAVLTFWHTLEFNSIEWKNFFVRHECGFGARRRRGRPPLRQRARAFVNEMRFCGTQ